MPSPTASAASPRASNENARNAPKPNRSGSAEPESLSEQIDAVRSELQTLTKSIGDVASKQWGDARTSAEDSIRRNPLVAVGIAAGLGFLYALIRR